MKTIIISLSLLLSVSLLSPSSFASYPELKKSRKTNLVVVTVKEFIEIEINLEKWMMDLRAFHADYALDSESDIQIEDWMTKEFSVLMENDSDQEVTIEDWMTNTFDFLYQEDFSDPEPEIEAWMCEIIR